MSFLFFFKFLGFNFYLGSKFSSPQKQMFRDKERRKYIFGGGFYLLFALEYKYYYGPQ